MAPITMTSPCREPLLQDEIRTRLAPALPGLVVEDGFVVLHLERDALERARAVLALPEDLPLPRPVFEVYLRGLTALALDADLPRLVRLARARGGSLCWHDLRLDDPTHAINGPLLEGPLPAFSDREACTCMPAGDEDLPYTLWQTLTMRVANPANWSVCDVTLASIEAEIRALLVLGVDPGDEDPQDVYAACILPEALESLARATGQEPDAAARLAALLSDALDRRTPGE